VKAARVALIAVLLPSSGFAEDVPLPRPRPTVPVPEVAIVDPEPPEPSACQIRLVADRLAWIKALPTVRGPRDCGAIDLVELQAVLLPDRTRVPLNPPATLRCEMAEALARWVRDEVPVSLAKLGGALRSIENYNSYECRGRNRIFGAKTSEHGRGNAIDLRGLRLSDGRYVQFTDRALSRDFRETVRGSACGRFTTVLGPGSDGHHEQHIHLDLTERRNGYRMCKWDVLDPMPETPLPRPRPAEAPQSAALADN
jgi:hypothetical protein